MSEMMSCGRCARRRLQPVDAVAGFQREMTVAAEHGDQQLAVHRIVIDD